MPCGWQGKSEGQIMKNILVCMLIGILLSHIFVYRVGFYIFCELIGLYF